MTYQQELDLMMLDYPSLFQREEDALEQLFLTNGCGYEWGEDGNMHEVGRPVYPKTPGERSIAYIVTKRSCREEMSNCEKSYWFDFHMIEHKNRMNGDKLPRAHFSYDWCNLTRLPDNITEDWARAVVKCSEWIYSTCNNIDRFVKHHMLSRTRFIFGGTESWREKLREENPDSTIYEIDCMYADMIEAEAIKRLTNECEQLQQAALYAATFCHTLYDIPAGLPEMQHFPMDTSKPSWYVEPEDRDEFNRTPFNAKPDDCILAILRHKKTPEEIELDKQRAEVASRLITEILAEEQE